MGPNQHHQVRALVLQAFLQYPHSFLHVSKSLQLRAHVVEVDEEELYSAQFHGFNATPTTVELPKDAACN